MMSHKIKDYLTLDDVPILRRARADGWIRRRTPDWKGIRLAKHGYLDMMWKYDEQAERNIPGYILTDKGATALLEKEAELQAMKGNQSE